MPKAGETGALETGALAACCDMATGQSQTTFAQEKASVCPISICDLGGIAQMLSWLRSCDGQLGQLLVCFEALVVYVDLDG